MPTQTINSNAVSIATVIEACPPPPPLTKDWGLYAQWSNSFCRGQPGYDLRSQNPPMYEAVQKVLKWIRYVKELALQRDYASMQK